MTNIEDTILRRINLYEYLEDKYNVRWVNGRAKCPVHSGNNPTSFAHYRNVCTCYSCGFYGNIINFVQEVEKLDYFGAIQLLCRENDIEIPGSDFEIIATTNETYSQQCARAYKDSRYTEYLRKTRGLKDSDIQKFMLGSEDGAIVFPLRTLSGLYAGITKRYLHYEAEGKPKYKHTKSNELIDKGGYLYGLYENLSEIRKQRKVYIVEGYFDAISGYSQSVPTVAYCGSNITKAQIEGLSSCVKDLLPRFSVYIVPDNDDKLYHNAYGIRERFKKYAPQLTVKIALLPNGVKDFSDLHVSGQKICELKAEPIDLFVLKEEINRCSSTDEEYNVAKDIISQINNDIVKSQCVEFLSGRWVKDANTISEWLKVKGTDNDLLIAFKTADDGLSELMALYSSDKLVSGWPKLDSSIGPLYKGDVIIVSARPACGKTWFGCQAALNLVEQGKRGILISLEMSTAAIYQRIISMALMTPLKDLQTINNNSERIAQAKEKIKDKLFIIADNSVSNTTAKIQQLINFANQRVFDLPVDFIVLDYLQYLQGGTQYEILSQEASSLKPIAKSNNVLFIALAQLGRTVKSYEKPSLENLRGAGEIEQVGDLVLGLYRPFLNDVEGDRNAIITTIMKARRGAIKEEIGMRFNPDKYRIEET